MFLIKFQHFAVSLLDRIVLFHLKVSVGGRIVDYIRDIVPFIVWVSTRHFTASAFLVAYLIRLCGVHDVRGPTTMSFGPCIGFVNILLSDT